MVFERSKGGVVAFGEGVRVLFARALYCETTTKHRWE